jgi:hypothetical protein
MLLETHTQKFNILQLQYLETVFERLRQREKSGLGDLRHYYAESPIMDGFGDFSSPEGYAGHVPCVGYLSQMLNRVIEEQEHDANQHTSLLKPDQLAIDDSHKVNSIPLLELANHV